MLFSKMERHSSAWGLNSENMPLYTFDVIVIDKNVIFGVSQGGRVMDQIKIGKFIAEMRKKQGFTQK